MVKVITYGTYDLLHYGHIRLLERAKALGDYLIVGVTADGFDQARGKINVQQSLMERIEAVKATGLADEIIVEEYEGQKIDDILRYNVDVFAIGSDWEGKFDYLNEYSKVVYLPRTEGVSSTELRAEKRSIRLGVISGDGNFSLKFIKECGYVNGIKVVGLCTVSTSQYKSNDLLNELLITEDYRELIDCCDAVFINSIPRFHNEQIKYALSKGKHVLCDSPIDISMKGLDELHKMAVEHKCILMDALRTAYSTAYHRMLLLVKGGRIGEVVSVDATCTTLRNQNVKDIIFSNVWNSISAWGPTAMLPIFQILGTDFCSKRIYSKIFDAESQYDLFTRIDFQYNNAIASAKVGKGVKSEGSLIVTGTQGYVYVPAPWWKTEYFEIRYEDSRNNKKYFYQLDGDGIRYEVVSFVQAIKNGQVNNYLDRDVSKKIVEVISDYISKKDTFLI